MTLVLDRRQEVLDRLFILLSELYVPLLGGPNGPTSITPNNVVRNRNEVQADKLPGLILLDGDEIRDSRATLPPRGQEENAVPTEIMRMTPEIYVVLDVRGIQNENVGEDLNTARLAILGTILPDRTLQSIVGANGSIMYDACVTDLARNRAMRGQLGISISFIYPLIGNEVSGIPSP